MRIKVCGVTQLSDVDLLGALPVDFVGLWYGVQGGHADVPLAEFVRLAGAVHVTQRLQPVLVTLLNDVEALREAVLSAQVGWIQLHGYQLPPSVRALKNALPDGVKIIKALHLRGRSCVERPLIHAYERAGVDVFLFDTASEDGRVGSTGRSLDAGVVSALAERLTRPFLLAGGISSQNCGEHRPLIRHRHFLGIDFDTNARGLDGKLRSQNIEAIIQAWKACRMEGQKHVEQLH